MDPGRFARLKELLIAARRRPEDERRAWLRDACGDDEDLLREVQSLLDRPAESQAILSRGSPFASEAEALRALSHHAEQDLPRQIGPYRILGVLGLGGMGIVYRAEQTRPIRRDVALKSMRGDQWTGALAGRLEGEAQFLARLNHPHIAQIFDVGLDERGNPYLVMELVNGEPIIEFCDRKGLSIRERLDVFRKVGYAVQHAHQKGIIHRDLKPSNILIVEQDGMTIPKIIDFGIAKMKQDAGGDLAQRTRTGQLLGTPEYMSPEQILGAPESVDTRSDVYSLGVLLYQLLTGRMPYEFANESVGEVARVIGSAPPRSLRAMSAPRIAEDLETVVLTALSKEPERRYPSAAALADDVGRYLDSQPIQARPPTALYQIRKLISRHRVPFALIAASVLLLVVSAVTMSILFEGQRRARTQAQNEAKKSTQITQFLQEMLTAADPKDDHLALTVREVLDRAAGSIDHRLIVDPEILAALHSTIGNAYSGIGAYALADSHLRRALEIRRVILPPDHPEIARSLYDTAQFISEAMYSHRMAEAGSLAQAAIEIYRASPEADEIEIAAALNVLGSVRFRQDRYVEAESLARACYFVYERRLGAEDPRTARALVGYAIAKAAADIADPETEPLLKEAVRVNRAVFGDSSHIAGRALQNLGLYYYYTDRLSEAETTYREALDVYVGAVGEGHPNAQTIRWWLIQVLLDADPRRAEPEVRDYLKRAGEAPHQDAWRIAWAEIALGYSLSAQGRPREAERQLLRGAESFEAHPIRADYYTEFCERAGVEHFERQGKTAEAARWRSRIAAATQ